MWSKRGLFVSFLYRLTRGLSIMIFCRDCSCIFLHILERKWTHCYIYCHFGKKVWQIKIVNAPWILFWLKWQSCILPCVVMVFDCLQSSNGIQFCYRFLKQNDDDKCNVCQNEIIWHTITYLVNHPVVWWWKKKLCEQFFPWTSLNTGWCHYVVVALVLVPTRELCLQVYGIAQQLVHRFHWIVPGYVMGGENRAKEKARLRKGISCPIV